MKNKISELEIGKAAEHLVCADLILNGHRAFLSDQGLPYDIVVDIPDVGLKRIQVKSTTKLRGFNKTPNVPAPPVYRFSLKYGKGSKRKTISECDYFAFVALDAKKIAYVNIDDLRNKNGMIIQIIEFRTKTIDYTTKTSKKGLGQRFIEDFNCFLEKPKIKLVVSPKQEISNIYLTQSGSWRVQKNVRGKKISGGAFKTLQEAISVRDKLFDIASESKESVQLQGMPISGPIR